RTLRRRVGLIGHGSGLFTDLTPRENAHFWARAAGAGAADGDAALNRLGVESRLLDVPIERLSAGQQRRVAIAAVAARRPELWLLDEPHAGLDQLGRDIVDTLITDAAAAGATVLVASHELDRVRPLAPRVVTIAGGTVHHDSVDTNRADPAEAGFDPAEAGDAH
ncbi:MAG: ATP-binding cassette domain-containing protein, partial [Acidimicrobiales bacterium]|nr:ATP-binding cassette domain-containing protein [Acidimicrobiales bacterium]